MKGILVIMCLMLMFPGYAASQTLQAISLPKPALSNDKPLMQAMAERKSSREFADSALSLQDLANVLWCANGVNRPENGHRTAPSAMNRQDIDVYAVLKEGIYLYDAAKHELTPVEAGDFRKDAGTQDYVGTAPLNIMLVSDLAKFDFARESGDKLLMAALDAGHCSQNVYLYCAAANLACVTRASVDKVKLGGIMKLRAEQTILLGLTVGYPPTGK